MSERNIGEDFSSAVRAKINENIIEKISGNTLLIKEENKNTKNSQIEIRALKRGCYAFKMDSKPREIYMLKEYTKVNDELLLCVEGKKLQFI